MASYTPARRHSRLHKSPITYRRRTIPRTTTTSVSTASATIKQGKYYLAISTNCTSSCAALIGSSTGVGFTFAGAVQESVTTGGTLPNSITIPSDSYTATTIPTWSIQ